MMTSVDYNYQNALREAIVFSNFSAFLKNRSCVTQIYTTKILANCRQMRPSCKCSIGHFRIEKRTGTECVKLI